VARRGPALWAVAIVLLAACGGAATPQTMPSPLAPSPTPAPSPPSIPVSLRPDTFTAFYVVEADGTGLRQLLPYSVYRPSWSPDGRFLAFGQWPYPTDVSTLYVLDVETGAQTAIAQAPPETSFQEALWSPAGDLIAASVSPVWPREHDTYLFRPDGSQAGVVQWAKAIDWAPDGSRLLLRLVEPKGQPSTGLPNLYHLAVLDPLTMDTTVIARDVSAHWLPITAWSPDGRQVAYLGHTGGACEGFRALALWVVGADGQGRRRLTPDICGDPASPAWSPDGTRIAFANPAIPQAPPSTPVPGLGPGVNIVEVESGALYSLGVPFPVSGVRWLDDEHLVAEGANCWTCEPGTWFAALLHVRQGLLRWWEVSNSLASSSHGSRLALATADGRLVVTGPELEERALFQARPFVFSSLAWSPDGSRIAFSRSLPMWGHVVVTVGLDGGDLQALPLDPRIFAPALSPDWTRVAYYLVEPDLDRGEWEGALYVARADGSQEQAVARGLIFASLWSPDGARLAYLLEDPKDDSLHLVVSAPDGSGLRTLKRWADALNVRYDLLWDWLADGRHIFWSLPLPPERDVPRPENDVAGLIDVDTDAETVTRGTPDYDFFFPIVWAPDASRLAFWTWVGLAVMDTDGTDRRVVSPLAPGPNPRALAWAPDGRRIAFAAPRDPMRDEGHELYVVDVETGQERLLWAGQASPQRRERIEEISWSPDGRHIAFIVQVEEALKDGSHITWLEAWVVGQKTTRLLSDASGLHILGWSPDGRRLALDLYHGFP